MTNSSAHSKIVAGALGAMLLALVGCQRQSGDPLLKIASAQFGSAPLNKFADCKSHVVNRCADKPLCRFQVNESLCGSDPAPGEKKELTVFYSCGGDELSTNAQNYDYIEISCK